MACRDTGFDKGFKLLLDGKNDLTTGANVFDLLHTLSVDHSGLSCQLVGQTTKISLQCFVKWLLLFGVVYILIKLIT